VNARGDSNISNGASKAIDMRKVQEGKVMRRLKTLIKCLPALPILMVMVALPKGVLAQGQNRPAPPARGPGIDLALQAAKTAVATCTANGYNVSVTVIDSGGITRLVYANDKAGSGPIDSATRKAYTALQFKEATVDVATQAAADPAIAAKISADPKMFARAGGFPLLVGADLVGAIGVGGAPGGEKDAVCAQAGIAQIQAQLK
jgi:uncharacterized protein GlcG (DUF336 family)